MRRIPQETENDDERLSKFADVGLKRETRVGSDMAPVDGDYSAAIDHRPPRFWKGLAASRWSPLDLQKFHAVKVRGPIVSPLQQVFCSFVGTAFLISYLGSPGASL
jgi:hypothetical protein